MPIAAAPKIRPLTAWSFSRYSDFKTCKALFMYKHLMGMKEPGNDAMQRGTDIHKMGEQFLKGITPKLPAELSLFPDEFKQVKKEKVKSVEDTWVWTQDWKQETVFNDWAGAWVRIKIDVCYINVKENVSVPIDLKTGKIRDERQAEYMEQLPAVVPRRRCHLPRRQRQPARTVLRPVRGSRTQEEVGGPDQADVHCQGLPARTEPLVYVVPLQEGQRRPLQVLRRTR
jgi:hypothetical protein